ncbi:MAG TPA: hypothetical protein VM098_05600 [Phycisphaerae bacterium]|nr:hypothetical protein [Phycisphaerae bacterium]
MIRMVAFACLFAVLPQPKGAASNPEQPPDARAALKQEVKDFAIDATLDRALAKLEELAGVKIVVDWKALQAAGVRPDVNVIIFAESATVGKLLETALSGVADKKSPLVSYADKDVVRVTTEQALVNQARAAKALADKAKARGPRAPVEFNMEEVPLSDVIDFIREASGANFSVNYKALSQVGVDQTTPVTLKAKGISFAKALDLVTQQLNGTRDKLDRVYWLVEDGVVTISTGEALNQELSVRVFDVADLLVVIPNFESPRMDLSRDRNKTDGQNDQSGPVWTEPTDRDRDRNKQDELAEKRRQARESLIEMVKGTIGKDMWQDGGGKGTIQLVGNRLVISQTPLGFKLMANAVRSR